MLWQCIMQESWKFPIKGLMSYSHPSHFLFTLLLLHLCILIPSYYGLKSYCALKVSNLGMDDRCLCDGNTP